VVRALAFIVRYVCRAEVSIEIPAAAYGHPQFLMSADLGKEGEPYCTRTQARRRGVRNDLIAVAGAFQGSHGLLVLGLLRRRSLVHIVFWAVVVAVLDELPICCGTARVGRAHGSPREQHPDAIALRRSLPPEDLLPICRDVRAAGGQPEGARRKLHRGSIGSGVRSDEQAP